MLAPNQPSLSGFALFCASKPRDETYNWADVRNCAVSQYLDTIDGRVRDCIWRNDGSDGRIAPEFLACGGGDSSSWTFGALHDRLIEAINAQ